VRITDATNGPAAVKAASTAPVAADPALVVAISPNTPALNVNVVSAAEAGTPKTDDRASSSLAPTASATLQFTPLTNAKFGRLTSIQVSAECSYKVQIVYNNGTTQDAIRTFYGNAGDPFAWNVPDDDYFVSSNAGNGTTRRYEAIVTNNDPAAGSSGIIQVGLTWRETDT
jgi:hypothetical protein